MAQSWLRRLGLRLQPLLQPTRNEDRRASERLEEAVGAQRSVLDRQKDELKELRRELHAVQQRLASASTDLSDRLTHQRQALETSVQDIRVVQRDTTRRLQTTISRQSAFVKGVLRNARHISDHAVTQERVLERLERLAASGRPIVVGPWTGEVGFELIYWAPFVRWFVEHFAVDPSRLVVVSRGGAASWYGELAGRYVDVFDHLPPSALVDAGSTRKQRHVGPRDRELLRHVATRFGRRMSVLHPLYLYGVCGAYFDGFMGVRPLLEFLRHRRIQPPPRSVVPGLPEQYVAAKFYFSASFPDTPDNRQFVDTLLAQIAERWPVVLLDHGASVDDHRMHGGGRYLDLTSAGATVTPRNNLDIQTAVVGGARAFVGTYGGFSYLAPLCGVESVAFHSTEEFYLHHRHLADVAFSRVHEPPLTVLSTQAAQLTRG